MKTAILLGAGSSLPAGYPSTSMSDRPGFVPGTASISCTLILDVYDSLTAWCAGFTAEAERCFSDRNKRPANFSARNERPANYEDLFYLAEAIIGRSIGRDGESRCLSVHYQAKSRHVAIGRSLQMQKTRTHVKPLAYPDIPDDFRASCSSRRAITFRISFGSGLRPEPTSTNHLKIFVEACGIGNVTGISTLVSPTPMLRPI